jgi:hypothetical protein
MTVVCFLLLFFATTTVQVYGGEAGCNAAAAAAGDHAPGQAGGPLGQFSPRLHVQGAAGQTSAASLTATGFAQQQVRVIGNQPASDCFTLYAPWNRGLCCYHSAAAAAAAAAAATTARHTIVSRNSLLCFAPPLSSVLLPIICIRRLERQSTVCAVLVRFSAAGPPAVQATGATLCTASLLR